MPSQARPPSLATTQRLSRLLALSCLALIIFLPIAEAIYWAVGDPGALAVNANLAPHAVANSLLPWQRATGALLMEIPLILLLIGVWHARKCFLLFNAGRVFTPEAIRYLRQFAGWSVASAAANIICKACVSMAITVQNLPGQRMLAIGIGTDQLFLLFFAAMVWWMSAIISEGLNLADENAAFI